MQPTPPTEPETPSSIARTTQRLLGLSKDKLTILVGLGWATFFGIRYALRGNSEGLMAMSPNWGLMLLSLGLTFTQKWAKLGVHLHLLNLSILLCSIGFVDTNNFPITLWGLPLIPLLASLLLGLRETIAYVGLTCALTFVALMQVEDMHYHSPDPAYAELWLAFRICMLVTIALIAGTTAHSARRRLKRRIEHSEAIQTQIKDARRAKGAKATLLAHMSHEIRTPMNGILGMTRFLQDSELPTAARTLVDGMAECALQLMSLLNRILDLSKLESGQMEFVSQPVDLGQELETLVAELCAPSDGATPAIKLITPQTAMITRIDARRFRQVVQDLIEHTKLETQSAEICVELHCPRPGTARIEIRDQDAHSDNSRPLVLSNTPDDLSGTQGVTQSELGLTLALAARIAQRLGGQIASFGDLESHGHFVFDLPLCNLTHSTTAQTSFGSASSASTWAGVAKRQHSSQGLRQIIAQQRTRRLKMLCGLSVLVLGYYGISCALRGYPKTGALMGVGFCAVLGCWGILRTGRTELASRFFLVSFLLTVSASSYFNGQLFSQTMWLLTMMPFMSAHLLGARAAIYATLGSATCIALLALAGHLHPLDPEFLRSPVDSVVFLCFYLLDFHAVAIFTNWTSSNDETYLKAQNNELDKAKSRAEKASRDKDQFLINMSHEIRTPMNGVLGFAEHLHNSGLEPKYAEAIDSIHRCGGHFKILLDEIFDGSRSPDAKLDLRPGPFQLHQVIHDTARLFETQAKQRGLSLQVAPDLPTQPYLGDSTRILQILSNLVGNAIKYSDQGVIQIRVALGPLNQQSDPPARSLKIHVQDQGLGMSPKECEQVFQRYQQIQRATHLGRGGTGLGLQISRNLAWAMGGDLRVQSELGEGSTFTLSIELPELAPSAPSANAKAGCASGPDTGQNKLVRVLVVDDNDINRRVASLRLQSMGCEVHCAENGAQAVELCAQQDWDLVLMDLRMPVMDGLAATRAIRKAQNPDSAPIPIVALTADGFAAQRQACLDAGMDDHLTKPFRSEELRELLQRFCGCSVEDAA